MQRCTRPGEPQREGHALIGDRVRRVSPGPTQPLVPGSAGLRYHRASRSPTPSGGGSKHSADQRANDKGAIHWNRTGVCIHIHTHGGVGPGRGHGQAPPPTRSRHGRQEGRTRRVMPAQDRDLPPRGALLAAVLAKVSPNPHSAVGSVTPTRGDSRENRAATHISGKGLRNQRLG